MTSDKVEPATDEERRIALEAIGEYESCATVEILRSFDARIEAETARADGLQDETLRLTIEVLMASQRLAELDGRLAKHHQGLPPRGCDYCGEGGS